MKCVLGYLGIGFILLLLTALVDKKFKLKLFWEYDPWFGWDRNCLEFFIVLGWFVLVPICGLAGLCFLLFRLFTLVIGKEPPKDDTKNDLRSRLLSEGVSELDADAIVKEIEDGGSK
jgi:hypothetical protein